MTLTLAWVTPFGAASDVGAFSRNLLLEFAREAAAHQVAVTVFVNVHGESFWSELPVVHLTGTAQDREILAGFDCVVFNVGNNQENHGHINRLAVQVPGVLVVHDLIMQHYFAWEVFERLRRRDLYARLIGEYYGAAGLEVVGRSQVCCETAERLYSPWDSQHVAQMTLIEPFVHAAAAVVVHSRFAAEAVARMTDAPLLRLQLPWDQKSVAPDEALEQWAATTRSADCCLVVCFGHIARNKNLERVVQAFAASRVLRSRARLAIVGHMGDSSYVEQLRAQVADQGLGRVVSFAFDVPDDLLAQFKHEADVFVNLRFPNTEGASGSVVEQLNSGKPVVMYPTGSYAEIPHGAAIRVERESGLHGLVAALEAAVLDPQLRVEVGAAGRRHVREVGRVEYVEALCRFLHEHQALLRARKACAVGRRAPAPDRAEIGEEWLQRVTRTRRLFDALTQERHQLDLGPFAGWDEAGLRRFVAVGLFGQTLDSPFERALRRLMRVTGLSGPGRHELYRVVSLAHLLWDAARTEYGTAAWRTCLAHPVLEFAAYRLLAGLDLPAFVRCGYAGLLRRHADPDGASYFEASAAATSFGGMLRGRLDSTEFAEANPAVDAEAMRAFRQECDAVPSPDVEYPPLPLGAAVEITDRDPDCRRYLLGGWHDIEELAVWGSSSHSLMLFRPAEALGERATLSVTGRLPGVRLAGPRLLQVRVNAGPAQAFSFADEEWTTVVVDLPELEPEERGFLVEFDVGEVVNLERLGIDPESRDLGFRLLGLTLARVDVRELCDSSSPIDNDRGLSQA